MGRESKINLAWVLMVVKDVPLDFFFLKQKAKIHDPEHSISFI